MKTNVKQPKSGTKSSLMNLKKAELVNIILRKDAVDKDKSNKLIELQDNYLEESRKVNAYKEELFKANAENATLNTTNNELKSALDEDACIIQELKNKLKFWRDFAVAFVLITIMVVVLKAIL